MPHGSHATLSRSMCRVKGRLAASVVGWALLAPAEALVQSVLFPDRLWSLSAPKTIWTATTESVLLSVKDALGYLLLVVVVGLPPAWIVCLMVGYPVWMLADASGLTRKWDAAWIGATVGLALHVAWVARLWHARTQDPDRALDLGSAIVFGGTALYVMAVGAAAGLAARWAGDKASIS